MHKGNQFLIIQPENGLSQAFNGTLHLRYNLSASKSILPEFFTFFYPEVVILNMH